jgi:hypothetical protein
MQLTIIQCNPEYKVTQNKKQHLCFQGENPGGGIFYDKIDFSFSSEGCRQREVKIMYY